MANVEEPLTFSETETMAAAHRQVSSPSSSCSLLEPFNLFGWCPDPSITEDENYMDLVLLVTRNSACQVQGHCGSLLVNPNLPSSPVLDAAAAALSLVSVGGNETKDPPPPPTTTHHHHTAPPPPNEIFERRIYGNIIGAATNKSLFHEADSDIHAEIACLGQACRNSHSTQDCIAYITIPPCKRCFAALVTFGIKRIVSRQLPPFLILEAATKHGIDVVALTPEMNRNQMKRINDLVNRGRTDEELMQVVEQRKQWREAKRLARKSKSTS